MKEQTARPRPKVALEIGSWDRAKYCDDCKNKGDQWWGHMFCCPVCAGGNIRETARRWVTVKKVAWWEVVFLFRRGEGYWQYCHEPDSRPMMPWKERDEKIKDYILEQLAEGASHDEVARYTHNKFQLHIYQAEQLVTMHAGKKLVASGHSDWED